MGYASVLSHATRLLTDVVECVPMDTPDREEDYVVLKSAERIKAEDSPFLAGCEEIISAGGNFCQFVGDSKTRLHFLRALISGWPGCGKTIYPLALAAALNRKGCPYAYTFIRCGGMATKLGIEEALDRLEEVEGFLEGLDSPAVVAFDELDALAPGRTDQPTLLRLTMWVMEFLGSDSANPPTVTLGITNDPLQVDKAVRDRFQADIYFPLPTDDQLIEILAHHGVPDPKQVLAELKERLPGSVFTGRAIDQGMKTVLALLDVASASATEVADCLFPLVPPVQPKEIRNYEQTHRLRRKKSQVFLKQWLRRKP